MIPNSIAAVVSFLLLLAPGIVWELKRARHEPTVKESTLMEFSRVVLASLMATLISAVILLAWIWQPLYQAAQASDEDVLASSISAVPYMGAVVATTLLACALSLAGATLRWPGSAPISGTRVWHQAFVKWRPASCAAPHLIVELLDDTVWRGTLLAFDSDPEDNQRGLALGPPLQRKRKGADSFQDRSANWKVLLVPENQIKSIQIAYPPQPS